MSDLDKPFFLFYNMKYTNYHIKLLADLHTPLGLYLKLRDKYSKVLLLESSDYSSKEDSQSYLCFDSLSSFILENSNLIIDGELHSYEDLVTELDKYQSEFTCDNKSSDDGLFGFSSFDSVQYFEKIKNLEPIKDSKIPTIRYDFFRFTIKIDHFRNTLELIEHCPVGQDSQIQKVKNLIMVQDHQTFNFKCIDTEQSNITGSNFKANVAKAKDHCQRGDVFQMVLSRQFRQKYKGDDLNVYRALRSINPSPYLFYFDYGSYKIFGSSPEAQLKVTNGVAEIHPIAGTFRRTGNAIRDRELAQELLDDPKESAEHVMLVDLARNDLSKNCKDVEVTNFKEVQYFSHVIHLVSKVTGQIKPGLTAYKIFADTFPAGTLSGAPKYRALQLIDKYETQKRGFYGGGIGMLGFDGGLNHAIIIRSFVSIDNTLYYQAGAGIVISSDEEKELQEVNNKLAALKKALILAQEI